MSLYFLVILFGLCNASSIFQRLTERVLAGLARDIYAVYLDDIIVMGATFDKHLCNLKSLHTECWTLFETISMSPNQTTSGVLRLYHFQQWYCSRP